MDIYDHILPLVSFKDLCAQWLVSRALYDICSKGYFTNIRLKVDGQAKLSTALFEFILKCARERANTSTLPPLLTDNSVR